MNDYDSPLKTAYEERYGDLPRTDIVDFIAGYHPCILEIGCGAGATGKLVKEKYPETNYCGIEIEEKAAAIACTRLDSVFVGDVERMDLESHGIKKEAFDLIICADILEHLYDPWKALFSLRRYLKPDGRVIASIPNVQNIHVIRLLCEGKWTYAPSGILDATHIRFFTFREIVSLFQKTGYQMTKYNCILQRDVDKETWPQDIDLGKILFKGVSKDEAVIFYTFQYIIEARKVA